MLLESRGGNCLSHAASTISRTGTTPKPLNAVARYLLVAAGTVAAGLGMVGVFDAVCSSRRAVLRAEF